MRTDITMLDSSGTHMQMALDTVEGLADVQKLSPKETLHLRLLAEEVLAMVRMVVTDFTARFWAEGEGKKYKIVLEADVLAKGSEKQVLLSLSSTGENEANLGIGQRIARMFRVGVHSQDEDGYSWSLNNFKKDLQNAPDSKLAQEHLEKSVIANLATNVRVSIDEGKVKMIVDKDF